MANLYATREFFPECLGGQGVRNMGGGEVQNEGRIGKGMLRETCKGVSSSYLYYLIGDENFCMSDKQAMTGTFLLSK